MNEKYQWIPFYKELADKLHTYKNRKDELFELMKKLSSEYQLFKFLHFERDEWWSGRNYHIDPFTVMAVMNRGISNANRKYVGEIYAEEFDISSPVPTEFTGIPVVNNMSSFFNDLEEEYLWDLFDEAITYAATKNVTTELIDAFDEVRKIGGNGLARITMGLYWIRPNAFMPLDSNSRSYLPKKYSVNVPPYNSGGEEYFDFIEEFRKVTDQTPFYEISHNAWLDNIEPEDFTELTVEDWLSLLNEHTIFTKNNMIVMKAFFDSGGKATCTQLANKYGRTKNFYKNNSQILGEKIANETGIEVFEKNGKKQWWRVLFTGAAADEDAEGSTYWELRPELEEALNQIDLSQNPLYEEENKGIVEEERKPHFRKIAADDPKYLDFMERLSDEYDEFENFAGKTSAKDGNDKKISHKAKSYTGYLVRLGVIVEEFYGVKIDTLYSSTFLQAINRLKSDFPTEFKYYNENEGRFPNATINLYQYFLIYTREDFLDEVYLSENQYDTMRQLLKEKQNIILQGAPGVGKTFTAKRLAYSIMGKRDNSRLEFIQFHQNYSYEDFVMGYKPDGEGFKLKDGLFVEFCKKAESNSGPYFLIIDEINRGNISKVFGELLMAIENDYRGEKVKMPYSGELFSVPKNLYIIGMMNTADRSLALIDYALRRRFSFYEMKPGFQSDGFKKYQNSLHSETFDKIIERIETLNIEIKQDPTLGTGFQIGHSYFTGQTEENYDDSWLKRIVEFDILPMLNEYWFDNEEKMKEWRNTLMSAFNNES